jgi:hypothetical protein
MIRIVKIAVCGLALVVAVLTIGSKSDAKNQVLGTHAVPPPYPLIYPASGSDGPSSF